MTGHFPLYLAVEDQVSEFVLRRVVEKHSALRIANVFSRGGYGYLKSRACRFNQAAEHWPFLLLTDLDKGVCAPDLVREWLGGKPRHSHFLLRVAVPEVESWLLADSDGLRRFLGLRGGKQVPRPEDLADAKRALLLWAENAAARDVRDALVWRDRHGQRHQGPDYNGTLARFVQDRWNLQAAAGRCQSLAGLIRAVEQLDRECRRGRS
jgi:hypothetical protein